MQQSYDVWFKKFFDRLTMFRKHSLTLIEILELRDELYVELNTLFTKNQVSFQYWDSIGWKYADDHFLFHGTKKNHSI
jgi:hypothetical protein